MMQELVNENVDNGLPIWTCGWELFEEADLIAEIENKATFFWVFLQIRIDEFLCQE